MTTTVEYVRYRIALDDQPAGFRKGEHFPAFFGAIRPYVTAIEEMQHHLVTRVAGAGKASTPS
ncbi:hypothetical protein OTB20_27510 [Streptomyces sp. H27-H1]|uniref:hypothetical protein n=1 Tax=Streptomyces sp. H27-H1 TaxID=2996461 RepID=UPI00226EBBCF|nr:hypothetical protein [Streptomyces sp. H27-H1]MCY0929872.1 hypothetical protein [Streptomyces sp. H27-H1]